MTATNHVLTGAVIGAAVTNPLLAIPLALTSHIILDIIPHFGDIAAWTDRKRLSFMIILGIDMVLAAIILGILLVVQPDNWVRISASGIVAASPDLMWIRYLLADWRGQPIALGRVAYWHSRIQTERAWGIGVETVWAIVTGLILYRLLEK